MIQFCRVSTLNVKSWQTGRCDMMSDLCLSKALFLVISFFGYLFTFLDKAKTLMFHDLMP